MPILSTDAALAWKGRRVLITGASGFIGRHVLAQAVTAGVEAHTIGRKKCPGAVCSHVVQLTDREAVKSAILDIEPEAVIHLAAAGVLFGSADFPTMLHFNVTSVDALLSACSALSQKPPVILVGTGFEYAIQNRPLTEDDPVIPSATVYGVTKAAGTATAGAYAESLDITVMRPFQIYGCGEPAGRLGPYIIGQALAERPAEVTKCEQLRDFLHIDDFARCLWLGLNERGEPQMRVYNAGSERPTSLRSFIEELQRALNQQGVTAEVLFGARPYRPSEPMIFAPNCERIGAELGWHPRISLNEGLADMVSQALAK